MRVLLFSMALGLSVSPAMASDRMMNHPHVTLAPFLGQPRWVAAAHCAGFYDTFGEVMERDRQADTRGRYGPADPDSATRANAGERSRRNWMVEYAADRMGRDRPGQPNAATFEAEAARQKIEHLAMNRTAWEYVRYSYHCQQLRSAFEWDQIRMRRGWADSPEKGD